MLSAWLPASRAMLSRDSATRETALATLKAGIFDTKGHVEGSSVSVALQVPPACFTPYWWCTGRTTAGDDHAGQMPPVS